MKNSVVYLRHILDAINRIQEYIADNSYEHFLQNNLLQDGVIRQLEIIGEAATNVSLAFRRNYTKLPWRQMVDIRNKLIHDYAGIDLLIVWDTVQFDLPTLKQKIEQIINLEEKRS